MKKQMALGAVFIGAGLLASRAARECGGGGFAKMLERMPDHSPPKWMFTNIAAIRANTERILQLLDGDRGAPAGEPSPPGG